VIDSRCSISNYIDSAVVSISCGDSLREITRICFRAGRFQ
jgi:hypothetical protein